MITLTELRWSNAFSYGSKNKIRLDDCQLTQLVGKNGHGKSSIALILEEVIFNKNSKGVKKGDILNRYLKEKSYEIALDFVSDGIPYTIETKRGATQTVKLICDGVDVSAHTPTGTYKLIEEIIGMDHKTFIQIVYQSHAGSLEFLTAPDTARKKFLIELLNLSAYVKAGELFKGLLTDCNKDLATITGKTSILENTIAKNEKFDTSIKPTVDIPEQPTALMETKAAIAADISNIDATNKRIAKNNVVRNKITNAVGPGTITEKPAGDLQPLRTGLTLAQKEYKDAEAIKRRIGPINSTCPTCSQPVDTSTAEQMVKDAETRMAKADAEAKEYEAKINELSKLISRHNAAVEAQKAYAELKAQLDESLPETELDASSLKNEVASLETAIASTISRINKAIEQNNAASAHNSKVEHVLKELGQSKKQLTDLSEQANMLKAKCASLGVLVKAFSTTGLVAYKIENLVKDLEELTNKYLGDLSGGRFGIYFQISGSDKLNVVINDNGKDIDITALSGGERARVNVATLLAIRKLMQTLSKSRINLLILDETVDALDAEGKEKLIEVLLNEEALNTLLVSHGFTHPLLEKVHVVKSNNISKIED